MSNEISIFNNPTVANNLQRMLHDNAAGGKAFLKFGKDGKWVYGVEETEITEDIRLAVNPGSIVIGFIAWCDGQAVEEMAGIASPPVVRENLPDVETDIDPNTGKPGGWKAQLGVDLKMLSGVQTEMAFKTSSQGGREALTNLLQAMQLHAAADPSTPVPVVKLSNASYTHKKYGKIYKPVLEPVDWVGSGSTPEQKRALV